MIIQLILIIFFRYIIKILFKNYDYHSLFRSFFCFGISSLSIITCVIYWKSLIENPISYNSISYLINTFMFNYMIYDLIYFIYSKKIRTELILHHAISGLLFLFYKEYFILTFCSSCEILSAFNWIGILFPNYEWVSKFIRLATILFVRLWIWIFTICLFYNFNYFFYLVFIIVTFFICLDIYWLYIIFINYKKYYGFIKSEIKHNIDNKKNKIVNKIKNIKNL